MRIRNTLKIHHNTHIVNLLTAPEVIQPNHHPGNQHLMDYMPSLDRTRGAAD
jgi:hypothetical protein